MKSSIGRALAGSGLSRAMLLPFLVAPTLLAPVTGVAGQAPSSVDRRAADGAPEVHYTVEARLDEDTDVLRGRVRIRYRNNSPDTLRSLYFHQYLNAFRPNSAWATRDLEFGIRTFQDLGPEDHAFERIRRAEVDGRPVVWEHPHAPDSTIVRLRLDEPLPPGNALTVEMDWDARLSTVPRRQGRAGRHYDFAQWYPRVVVFEDGQWRDHPLYRQGEFYGEFATYDVTLEVAEDQVLGSTGVPVSGDPGWEAAVARASESPFARVAPHREDWYDAGARPGRTTGPDPGPALGLLPASPPAGAKRVRWYAEDVHHFAWSANPDYIYEGGVWNGIPIHVLYRPGDEESWGGGIAVERTAIALQWLDRLFGPYAYPQVTNLHRIEGGGTEFPMLVMDGSASQGLILHEVGHIYAHGILANNEWYEGWLDEGLTSFQEDWFFEAAGAGRLQWIGAERSVLDLEVQGKTEPVVFRAEDYAEMTVYSRMIYTKGALIFRMLRDMAGPETMVEILRTYYDRYKFRHVDQEAFQSVAEEVMGRDLDWFFGPWLHSTGLVDYSMGRVRIEEIGGAYETRFTLERLGDQVMPVPVRLEGQGMVVDTVLNGGPATQVVRIQTRFRPDGVSVDPDGTILDWNASNNHWTRGVFRDPGVDHRLIWANRDPLDRREKRLNRYVPLAWSNNPGGLVLGVARHGSYLDRFRRSTLRVGFPGITAFGQGGESDEFDWGSISYEIENPVVAGRPRLGHGTQLFAGEGRVFFRHEYAADRSRLPVSGPRRALRLFGSVSAVYDSTYLVPGRWNQRENITVEGGLGWSHELDRGGGGTFVRLEGSTGISTRNFRYLRFEGEAGRRFETRARWGGLARVFVGASTGEDPDSDRAAWDGSYVPLERRMFLSGGGSYASILNPYTRSDGSWLHRYGDDPGGGQLRGFARGLSAPVLVALNLEAHTPFWDLDWLRVRLGLFADGGWVSDNLDGFLESGAPYDPLVQEADLLWDFGPAVELESPWSSRTLRLDFPVAVSDGVLAKPGGNDTWAFRVRFTFREGN